jgi:hypothetical protein
VRQGKRFIRIPTFNELYQGELTQLYNAEQKLDREEATQARRFGFASASF